MGKTSKFIDPTAIIQVIGSVYNTPQLLDYTDKYVITDEDFPEQFHKIVFGAIFKLHELGAEKITLTSIADFLASRPKSEAVYKQNKGEEWLTKVAAAASSTTFDYYYNRLKKFTLLRAYDTYGIDVTDIYDPDNIFDAKRKQLQEDQLDNATLNDLADKIDDKIDKIKAEYLEQTEGEIYQAGEDIDELIESLKLHPEVGVPLYGPLINTVTRGARLKKFYLRSAATGTGKTRSMIADACYIGCDKIYDEVFGWIKNGYSEPVLYITTEQEKDEVQTMMLAFLSNVNEEHITYGKYDGDEESRVIEAANILKNSGVHIVELLDFSIRDVENVIKKAVRDLDVKFVFNP